jgi:hypothetical protein
MQKLNTTGSYVVRIYGWHDDLYLEKDGTQYFKTRNVNDITFFENITDAEQAAADCGERRTSVERCAIFIKLL